MKGKQFYTGKHDGSVSRIANIPHIRNFRNHYTLIFCGPSITFIEDMLWFQHSGSDAKVKERFI